MARACCCLVGDSIQFFDHGCIEKLLHRKTWRSAYYLPSACMQIDFGRINAQAVRNVWVAAMGVFNAIPASSFAGAGVAVASTVAAGIPDVVAGYNGGSTVAADLSPYKVLDQTPDFVAMTYAGGVFDIGSDGLIRTCWTGPCGNTNTNYDGSTGVAPAFVPREYAWRYCFVLNHPDKGGSSGCVGRRIES